MIYRLAIAALVTVASLIAVLAGTLVLAGLWLKTQLPPTTGQSSLPGLAARVEVLRDANGIPHIFANTETDALMALGYVHAQDRLWQMESMRRAGAGRLAELFGTWLGDWPLRLDRDMRSLGLMRRAEEDLLALGPDTRAALEAYAAGVNGWLASRTKALPLEFQLLNHTPEPWRPADSLVWGKLMALQLSGNHREELFRAAALRRLSPERLNELFPGDGDDAATLYGQLHINSDQREALSALAALDPALTLAERPILGPNTASNGWALSGAHTSSGGPLIANDPHLGFSAPILWYLARIVLPDRDLSGATVPGVPFHILGQNGHVGWGFTTTGSDTQDLFVERLVDGDPIRYVTPDGPQPFKITSETIQIRWAEPEQLALRESRNGPVIRFSEPGALDTGTLPSPGHALALAFPALMPGDRTAEALHLMNRAQDANQFREALRLFTAPQQNIFYADRSGTLGMMSPARVPIRKAGDGRLPSPGWSADYGWAGFIPFDQLPQSLNPASGVLINANNAVVGPDYPHLIAVDWPDPARARRIAQLLKGASDYDVKAALAHQLDIRSLPAQELLPLMLAALPDGNDGLPDDARRMLADWDGEMARDRPEPLIFSHWLRALVVRLFADELGELFPQYQDLRPRAVRMALTSDQHWCDNSETAEREECKPQITAALDDALTRLSASYGPNIDQWRWGDEHQARFDHPLLAPLLSRLPLLDRLGQLTIATDGDGFTVNRGAGRVSDPVSPFAHRHGAGYRMVLDLAQPANSRHIIATGQSGNPLSDHWDDLLRRWRDGDAVAMTGDRNSLAGAGAKRLTLIPGAKETAP